MLDRNTSDMRSAIAETIRRDLLADTDEQVEVNAGPIEGRPTKCFCCRESFTYRRPADRDRNGRFCSRRCRDAYDLGVVSKPAKIVYRRSDGTELKPGFTKTIDGERAGGFEIVCPTCETPFVSLGLAYCCTRCTPKELREGCLQPGFLR
jgi:hypothetical protein